MTKPLFAAFEKALATASGATATMNVELTGEIAQLRWWSNAWSGGQHASVSITATSRKNWHQNGSVTDAFAAMMTELSKARVLPWTLEVTVRPAKAATRDAVRDALLAAMKEARANLPWPSDDDMERERKAFRQAERAKEKERAATRAATRKADALVEEKRRATVIADAKTDAVGDVAALIEVLGKRLKDPGRLQKTMSMLKKDGFELFSNVTDTQLEGVVKSQSQRRWSSIATASRRQHQIAKSQSCE